jgi:hypothetical protein
MPSPPDVTPDLQTVFTRPYDNGGCADFMDYGKQPPVALWPEEKASVDCPLQARELRDGH